MNEPRDKERLTGVVDADAKFAEQAKDQFDDSVDRLDAAALSRLNRARHEALDELRRPSSVGQWVRWMPATGIAAAVLVTVMVMRGPNSVDVIVEPVAVSDFELLLDNENLEMLEDLEFYSWLDSADLDTYGNVG
ncbi:MAG: hypothetical protein IIA07_00275 [Proteobacteria bacterium]|nr:hypothetical protein [Pseudomonadota bacterium]